ncbi:MAG: TetR/AcrR family transcriptional regulator [Proteobacteria bacterium]|nr:TetR/AcrR family transcriptional regulator [Pseudomonadota bacterium]
MKKGKKSTRKPGQKVKRMKGEDRRKLILRTAQRIFAEETYHGATTAKIARAVGVTEPTIYLHFPSKKALFLEVMKDVRRFILVTTSHILNQGGDLRERYGRIFDSYYQYTTEVNANVSKIWINAISVNDPDIQASLRDFMEEIVGLFSRDIRAAAEEDKINLDYLPEVLARILVAVSVGQEMMIAIGAGKDRGWVSEGVKGMLLGWSWGRKMRENSSKSEK